MVINLCAVMVMVVGAAALDPPPLHLPGDVIIGVIADLHGSKGGGEGCGGMRARAVEQVVAAEWALTTINNQSQQDYTIGVRVYDACGDPDTALRQTIQLLHDTEPPHSPLLGVVAVGSQDVVSGAASPLHAFTTPLIITDASAAHTITPTDNVFTTAPHLTDQLQAVLLAGVKVGGVPGVSVVCSCERAVRVLQERAAHAGLNILHTLQPHSQSSLTTQIEDFIHNEMSFGGVVLVLLSGAELNTFIQEVEERAVKEARLRWVFSTLGENTPNMESTHHELKKKFSGSLLVEVHSPVIPGFSQYFADTILSNSSVVTPLADQYINTISHCDPQVFQDTSSPCLEKSDLSRLVSVFSTTATVKAVSSLAAAFRLVQIERCSKGVHCLEALRHDLHQDVLQALLKLSFTVGSGADRIRYTADGRLVNTFTIKHITPQGIRQVGVYREDTGVVWTLGELLQSHHQEGRRRGRTLGLVTTADEEEANVIKSVLLTHEDYISRTWAFSVLVVACVGVVASLYIIVYVALRVCDGTLNGPQVLGGVLLVSVMGTYASCVVYVLPPSPLTCALREWAPPMCLALCYAILLVKAMHLRAVVTVGVGGQVSQGNLHVSLFFIVSVQAALCLLGHAGGTDVGEEPLVKIGLAGGRECGQKHIATLATRSYLLFLLLLSLILAAANHKIHRNHNEGRWLLLTACVSAPVVSVWTVMSHLAPPTLEPPTTSVALLVLASLVLGLVFTPKMRVIARQSHKFRHKRLATTSSVSTVFTQMEEGPVAGLPTLKDHLKPLPGGTPPFQPNHPDTLSSTRSSIASQNSYRAAFSAVYGMPQHSPLTTPRQLMRNPIYDASQGAYP